MDDVLALVASNLISDPSSHTSLIAFVKLQATHRGIWLLYRHDKAMWERLQATLPKWSLPPHMGLRRRVIAGIKLLFSNCLVCHGPAPRVFMAFQARFCRKCCHKLLISDHELAWRHHITYEPNAPYIVRHFQGRVRVRFYLKQHLRPKLLKAPYKRPSPEQQFHYDRAWPGLRAAHIHEIINQMT